MKLRIWGILTICIFWASSGIAQLKIYPIVKKNQSKTSSQARQASHTISLPIWEDFSTTKTNYPDTSIWENSEDVFINSGLGTFPPSINVASFDGLKGDGSPHKNNETLIGKTDSLMTHPIDLEGKADVYLSFFYQQAGYGDVPEVSDSIRLEFLNENNEWVTVWPRNGASLDNSGEFVQVLLPVDQPEYLHSAFRFKFVAFGRQSGPFDVWNVDYIYLNEGRFPTNTAYPDRTISTPMSSIFKNYTAIPRTHFNDALKPTDIYLYNVDFDDGNQAVVFDLETQIVNYLDSAILSDNNYAQNNVDTVSIGPGKQVNAPIPNIIPNHELTVPADSSILTYKINMISDDELDRDSTEIVGKIDFTINDNIQSTFKLKDYYAYDDGTAEVGIGLNSSGKSVALRYEKLGDTLQYLHAFDIYFPFVKETPNGKSIDLKVWSKIDTVTNEVRELYKETISINAAQGLNKFTRFELQNPVLIEDSIFYIGYRQNTSGDLSVGFDKNIDNGKQILYNLDGNWEVNTQLKGSMMFRPVFGAEPDEITGLPDIVNQSLVIYPNPTSDKVYINAIIDQPTIISIDGKAQKFETSYQSDKTMLNLQHLPKGIYLLRFVSKEQVISKKIIKQ